MSEISKLNRVVKLSSLILIAGILVGCVKPCQVNWYRGCPEDVQKTTDLQRQMNEMYRKQQEEKTKQAEQDSQKTVTDKGVQ